ncbi:MAG TPA: adenylate kinase, partial [Gemmatirosa sp.]
MIVVLFGKPGAGKGTQAPRLADALGAQILATGDVLRAALKSGTPLGLEAKRYMEAGQLVPDPVILGIVKEALAMPRFARGAVLDGVVRTVPQAEGLARVLAELGRALDAVLVFDIDDEEIVRRTSARVVCDKTQQPFTGLQPGARCPTCTDGTLVRRADDEPAAVRTRLDVYRAQTLPVLQWYEHDGVAVRTIDAVGDVDDVTARALAVLGIAAAAAAPP